MPEQSDVGVQVLDLLIPRRPEPRPQELTPPRQLVVRLHAHAASLSGWRPLPDGGTWVMSWLTLRRDRPNRAPMAPSPHRAPTTPAAADAPRAAPPPSPAPPGTAGTPPA